MNVGVSSGLNTDLPGAHRRTGSNLGALSNLIEKDSLLSVEEQSTFPARSSSYSPSQLNVDPAAIFASMLLLAVLLALSFERILGLDKWIAAALKEWRMRRMYERRNEIIQARSQLERLLSEDREEGD